MNIWNRIGRVGATATLVGVGLLVGLAAAGVAPAVGTEPQEAQTAVVSDAPMADMVPQGLFVEVAEDTSRAVVFIEAERPQEQRTAGGRFNDFFDNFFGRDRPQEEQQEPEEDEFQFEDRARSQGSGVLVSADGYVLTNAHVVAMLNTETAATDLASSVRVTMADDRVYDATIVGADLGTDIALLKIDARRLPFAPLGDSDLVRVGEWVMAIGAPFGLQNTVSAGIVSALGRANLVGRAQTAYQDFVQTDAAINPGNSGGPLVNLRGEVVGINTAIATGGGLNPSFSGVGFAVPANLAGRVMEQLREHGHIIRGYLGVTVQNLSRDLIDGYDLDPMLRGAIINTVTPDGPALEAGVEPGDIVIGTDDTPLESQADFLQRVANKAPGDEIVLNVLRNDEDGYADVDVPVMLTERPDEAEILVSRLNGGRNGRNNGDDPDARDEAGEMGALKLGLRVTELDERLSRQLNIPSEIEGVVVTAVAPNSPSARAGLDQGDVIRRVGRVRISSLEEFDAAISAYGGGDAVSIYFYSSRTGNSVFAAMRVPRD